MVQASRGTEVAAADPKREAFLRLAERRTNAVLEKIRILTNCANPYAYSYDEADVKKMFSVIEREVRIARGKFEQPRRGHEFKLRDG